MNRVLTALFGLVLCLSAFAFASGGAFAADQSVQLPALKDLASKATPLMRVDDSEYCTLQYFKCRHFSDSGPEFRACMRDRGCFDAYMHFREHHEEGYCHRWRDECGERWGRGNDRFYNCLRYHGCE